MLPHANTQNTNESMHNLVWRYCPKGTYVGRKTVEIAVSHAIYQFSVGDTYRYILCGILGIQEGPPQITFYYMMKLKKLKHAENSPSKRQTGRRKQVKYTNAAKELVVFMETKSRA